MATSAHRGGAFSDGTGATAWLRACPGSTSLPDRTVQGTVRGAVITEEVK